MSKPRYPWWGYVKSMVKNYEMPANNKTQERERNSVRAALQDTEQSRLPLLRQVFWSGSTLQAAAEAYNVPAKEARMWHKEFIYRVAHYYGFL